MDKKVRVNRSKRSVTLTEKFVVPNGYWPSSPKVIEKIVAIVKNQTRFTKFLLSKVQKKLLFLV